MALQSLQNAKRELINGDEKQASFKIRDAMHYLHKLSKSSEDPTPKIKAFVVESDELANSAQHQIRAENLKNQRLRQRIIFDGVIFYGVSSIVFCQGFIH